MIRWSGDQMIWTTISTSTQCQVMGEWPTGRWWRPPSDSLTSIWSTSPNLSLTSAKGRVQIKIFETWLEFLDLLQIPLPPPPFSLECHFFTFSCNKESKIWKITDIFKIFLLIHFPKKHSPASWWTVAGHLPLNQTIPTCTWWVQMKETSSSAPQSMPQRAWHHSRRWIVNVGSIT